MTVQYNDTPPAHFDTKLYLEVVRRGEADTVFARLRSFGGHKTSVDHACFVVTATHGDHWEVYMPREVALVHGLIDFS